MSSPRRKDRPCRRPRHRRISRAPPAKAKAGSSSRRPESGLSGSCRSATITCVITDKSQPTDPASTSGRRPVALVTGAGRTISIGTAVARRLAESGWDVAFIYRAPYDARRPWGAEPDAAATLTRVLGEHGARAVGIEADLASTDSPEQIFDQIEQQLGSVTALVLCHCESVPTGLLDTTIESFDRHFAVNTRAAWLMIREYGRRFRGEQVLGESSASPAITPSATFLMGPARVPWIGSPSRQLKNLPTWVCGRMSSTLVRSTLAG